MLGGLAFHFMGLRNLVSGNATFPNGMIRRGGSVRCLRGDHKILIISESVMAVIETETVGMKCQRKRK